MKLTTVLVGSQIIDDPTARLPQALVRRASKRNAKVVWWVEVDGIRKRFVLGQRDAVSAWKIFYALRAAHKKTGHIVAGPELWIGNKLVIASGNTEKGLVLPLRV